MPKKSPYDQFCPIARSLDLIGDRWSLLLVRELYLGPLRYGELLDALTPISTDVLAKRLRELESAAIIESGGDAGYGLTEEGRRLTPVLQELARWGSAHLRAPAAHERTAARALQIMAISSAGPGPTESITVRVDDRDHLVPIPARGGTRRGSTIVRADAATLWELGTGESSWDDAVGSGAIEVEGDARSVRELVVGRLSDLAA